MHEPQQNKTLAKDIDRGRSYVKKTGVNVDKYEDFEKNTHFGSFNNFSGYNCVISRLNVRIM